ncbi:hypothetical protein [Arthrobacter russicus]|uniref:Uncharacterized protein n=1 Tax=Arthrobacter russicus TaxID=172040 RepID=A0ABU1JFQ1_9MICC|nr:hypothetical protein [Arthrobacter russicus]MDR6271265.1 hypothetical protein [Arthrobacter russicus]
MDPVAIVASAFGGAIITGLVGLITHTLTGRREQKRWILDQKYRVYVDFLREVEMQNRYYRKICNSTFREGAKMLLHSDSPSRTTDIQEILLLAHFRLAYKVLLWSRTHVALVELLQATIQTETDQLHTNPQFLAQPLIASPEMVAAQEAESAASIAMLNAVRKELGFTEPLVDRVHDWVRKKRQKTEDSAL